MILAEIDLTATKILTPGFDIGRLPRSAGAGGRRETRVATAPAATRVATAPAAATTNERNRL